MLNKFESCSSRLFRTKSTHSPCSACCRKRVGLIRCKCNQNLERNESARRGVAVKRRLQTTQTADYGMGTLAVSKACAHSSRHTFTC